MSQGRKQLGEVMGCVHVGREESAIRMRLPRSVAYLTLGPPAEAGRGCEHRPSVCRLERKISSTNSRSRELIGQFTRVQWR